MRKPMMLAFLVFCVWGLSVSHGKSGRRSSVSVLQAGPRNTIRRLGTVRGPVEAKATFASFRSARVLEIATDYPRTKGPMADGPPISLTASDGTGLRLVNLVARAVLDGPLAFTELKLTFHNPENRVREGRFAITLPAGAAISRFAMRIQNRWQEAEVVERQRARQIYEDFLHRKQDPALLEKAAGNRFRARVFPIPANGVKDLIISYSQNLARLDQIGTGRCEVVRITAAVIHQRIIAVVDLKTIF